MIKKFKKTIAAILLMTTMCSCVTMHLDKDSAPLIDFGTPIVGHFRNKDYVSAGIFTSLFLSFLVCTFVFAPFASNQTSFTGLDTGISDPLFFSFLGATLATPVASTIETACMYHYVNQKIIDLNGIFFDTHDKLKKYEAINAFRADEERRMEEASNRAQLELYRREIEAYRQKLIDGTITDEELIFIEKSEMIRNELQSEIGYYYLNKTARSGGQ